MDVKNKNYIIWQLESDGISSTPGGAPVLNSQLDDPNTALYFIGDEPMTAAKLEARLRTAAPAERVGLLAEILREARDVDVWRFTTPAEVGRLWPQLTPRLGLRRPFWEFLLSEWHRQGHLELHQAQ